MGDGHPDIDDLPVTVGTLKTQGDIYAAGADAPDVRLIDTLGKNIIVRSSSDTANAQYDPQTGSTLAPSLTGDVAITRALADYINLGLANGNFYLTPPEQTTINNDNALPFWRTGGTATSGASFGPIVSTGSMSAGLGISFPNGMNSGDNIYIEQAVPFISQSGGGQWGWPRVILDRGTYGPGTAVLAYLALNGTEVVTAQINTFSTAYGDGFELCPTAAQMETWAGAYGTDTEVFTFRFGVRATATDTTAGTAYVTRAELMQTKPRITLGAGYSTDNAIASYSTPEAAELQYIRGYQDLSLSVGSLRRVISRSLVAIPFTLLNVPAGAITEMQISDNALAIGAPRIGSPWGGSIVGVSYRMSAAITAGGANALRIQATVAGASVWTAHTLTTASPQFGDASQAPDADTFTSGQQLGIQVDASGTFAPTTLDIACLLWVALRYTL